MDPRTNPYAPGAGTRPPELAGRDAVIEKASVALDRLRAGRSARSLVLYGLRGVGKTVLLNHVRLEAEAKGMLPIRIEAPEDRPLPELLVPALRSALVKTSTVAVARDAARRALGALTAFARSFKVKIDGVEMDVDLERGLADSGDLDNDLKDLLATVGEAAKARHSLALLVVDELQYVREKELSALVAALHDTSQNGLPLTILAAGLPQLLGQMGKAKSYAERLFEFIRIDRLDDEAAIAALEIPAAKENVRFTCDATAHILAQTRGYPYFLQEWGKHSWDVADRSPITRGDAERASELALAELDASFFRVRLDRLTTAERSYLRAMAELGPGPHRSGAIAAELGRKVTSLAPTRSALIRKGMIYSLAHGDTGFTVPLFDGFMKRIMPADYRRRD